MAKGRGLGRDVVFLLHLKERGIPPPVQEFVFNLEGGRKWRFDFSWPGLRVAVECEGIVYATAPGDHRLGGRHVSARGFKADVEKYAEAFALGWNVLRVLPNDLESGRAADLVSRHFALRELPHSDPRHPAARAIPKGHPL